MTTLLVENLSPKTTASDLQAVFSPFGEIGSIRVARDRAGRARGFALVDLEHRAAAIAMQTLKGVEVKGRAMDIVVDRPLSDGGRQLGRGGPKHERGPSARAKLQKVSTRRAS